MSGGEQETYRDRLRVRLLQVAEGVIASQGLTALQARRIAQEADCSVGTIYNIYGDIDGLILAANERTLVELGRQLEAAARRSAGGDAETRLMALAIAYLDFATANQRRWRAVFEHRLPDDRDVPDSFRADRHRLLAMIETELAASVPDPALRSDAAHALFSAVHGIVTLSLDAKLGPFDPAQCARQIRFIVENVVKGLA